MGTPDRLYIDIKDRDIINKIQDENLFDFKNATNKEKFLFAMAIGAHMDIDEYPIEKKDGFFLTKDLASADEALINVCAIKKFGSIDVLENKEKIYDYVQQCAHLGFKILSDEIQQSGFGSFEKQFRIKVNEVFDNLNLN